MHAHIAPACLWLIVLCLTAAPTLGQDSKAPSSPAKLNQTQTATEKADEAAQIGAKYDALVATLPPQQQAWERTLQQNLGTFYLPVHKRLRVQGRSSCWDYVDDDPKLPRVLLIGDSISGGYTLPARKALAGIANVHKAPENCGPTSNGLKKLDVWLGDGKWDVIHFNFGIHDRKTPSTDYAERLEQIIGRLQKSGAKLVWASTTPVPAGTKDGPAMPAAIVEHNQIAAEIMQRHGIAIDDLFTTLTPQMARVMKPDDVHPNGEGYALLGKQVAAAIQAALK
jgi:lysophospholipase L1-like esterase